ncbi:MAG: transketolase C-terminal domain-containing protein [Methanomassiliicoccales archaeon]
MERMAVNGDTAVAYAWKQVNPDVVAAYPITPQTIIVEAFSEYVANGEVDTEFVCSESEHSAMSLCIGASAAGARCATATASAGLALMWETLYIASSMRLPIVMAVANRALSAPINIHCDHGDSMGARDSGWVQLYGENVQEAYDQSVLAFRIGEHPDVKLPVMTGLDGFILTHAIENLEALPDEAVRDFVGDYEPKHGLLDIEKPMTYGPLDLQDWYFEHKYQQVEAMGNVPKVAEKVFDDYEKESGREYNIIEPYMIDDADYVVMAIGSTAGTLQAAVDELREEGMKAGCIKLRMFRPFPEDLIAEALAGKKAVAVMDRAISFGAAGPIFPEVRSALMERDDAPKTVNYIYGLGGRDVPPSDIKSIFRQLSAGESDRVNYLGVRI